MEVALRDHRQCLIALLERCRGRNILLNQDKFRFRLSEVRYAGHLFTSTGLRVDPSKVIAVEEMPTPSNKASVRRLLGVVNYLSRFVPQLADMAEPLRALTNCTYTSGLW